MFHNPPNGVMEWSTVEDSARLMAALCGDDVPDHFWRHFYNIGGGASARLINHEFMVKMMTAMGVKDFRQLLDPKWLATRNFHGQWYLDSDRLHELVPYRRTTIDQFFMELSRRIPCFVRTVMRFFPGLARKQVQKTAEGPGVPFTGCAPMIRSILTPISALALRGSAFQRTGTTSSLPSPRAIQRRSTMAMMTPNKPKADWTIADLKAAATYRGGQCHAEMLNDPHVPVDWECSLGRRFGMTPNLYLAGGHWCPTCQTDIDVYPRVAATNPFFAQVWPGPSASPADH